MTVKISRPRTVIKMSTKISSSNSIRITLLKKEVPVGLSRKESVEGRSFISTDSVEFPPLPKSDAIVYKDEQQRETATHSQNTKCHSTRRTQADNNKDIKPERQADSELSSHEASSAKLLESTCDSSAHVKSDTPVQAKRGRSKKAKKKDKQKQGGKISIVTPEMHRILSGERDSSGSDQNCVVDINSTEEYPELNQSNLAPLSSDQKCKVNTEGRFRYPNVSAISGGVSSSKSHDRTSYGWIFTRSFSDLLKATSTPASSSLKFRNGRNIPIQDKTTCGSSQSIPSVSPSHNKEEKRKRNKSVDSKQEMSLPKTENETLNPQDKSNKVEDGRTAKKIPNTSTPLNMSDFIVGVKSGKIKMSRLVSTGRSLEKKSSKGTPHNMLDSTAPLRKRGKEREVPKKKQLSTLKKIILRERELKKMLLSKELADLSSPQESVQVPQENSPLDGVHVACQLTDESKNLHDPCEANDLELKDDTVPVMTNSSEVKTTSVENTSTGSLAVDKRRIIAKQIIHSRNFREYCDQFISGEIDNLLSSLLQDLVRFQDRLYEKDPTKAKVKRRLVCGLKEVTKHLKVKKLKVILVAPDMERINSEGGLDDMLTTMLKLSIDHSIPCVFGLTRRKMGRILRKKVPVSCVGVFNYEGTEETFKPLMETVKEARVIYKDYFQRICDLLDPELIESLGESISEEEKQDMWRKITKDATPDGWAFDSVNNSCRKTEE